MKKANASLRISIDIECPHCESDINLLDHSQMTDDGHIFNYALTDEQWGCKGFNESFECPECEKEFLIEDIDY